MTFQPGHLPEHGTVSRGTESGRPLLWGIIPRVTDFLDKLGDRTPMFVFVLAAVVFMMMSAVLSRGGSAHPELEQYLPHYLSQKSLPQKIFDFQNVEIWGAYRPRPLSYLFDYADGSFIAWCCRHGFAHLLSLSFYVFWALEWVLLWIFFCGHLQLHRVTSGLLICLLSTDPVMSLSGAYFRSAKPGATCFLLISFVILTRYFRSVSSKSSPVRSLLWASFGAVAVFCSCLFDEIPAAFAVAALLVLMLERSLSRRSRAATASTYCMVPIGLSVIGFAYYSYIIHPKLVWHFTGQTVSMQYEAGTLTALLANPFLTLYGSVIDFGDIFGYLTGSISAILAMILMAVLVSSWGQRKAQIRLAAGALLMVACLYGMIARHPSVGWIDFRRTVYALPLTIVFVVCVAASLAVLSRRGFLSRGQIQLILLVLIASNIISLPAHRRIVESQFMDRAEFTRVLMLMLHSPFASSSGRLSDAELFRLKIEVGQSQVYKLLHRAQE
jgi:hypothetical protein